jgi:hypothetical protein
MEEKNNEILKLLINRQVIDAGELVISKSTLGKRKEGSRYLIYLPSNRCYIWRLLNERKIKVRVYLELPEKLSF